MQLSCVLIHTPDYLHRRIQLTMCNIESIMNGNLKVHLPCELDPQLHTIFPPPRPSPNPSFYTPSPLLLLLISFKAAWRRRETKGKRGGSSPPSPPGSKVAVVEGPCLSPLSLTCRLPAPPHRSTTLPREGGGAAASPRQKAVLVCGRGKEEEGEQETGIEETVFLRRGPKGLRGGGKQKGEINW